MSHSLLAMLLWLGLGAGESEREREPACRMADLEKAALYSLRDEDPALQKDPRWGKLFAGAYSTGSGAIVGSFEPDRAPCR